MTRHMVRGTMFVSLRRFPVPVDPEYSMACSSSPTPAESHYSISQGYDNNSIHVSQLTVENEEAKAFVTRLMIAIETHPDNAYLTRLARVAIRNIEISSNIEGPGISPLLSEWLDICKI